MTENYSRNRALRRMNMRYCEKKPGLTTAELEELEELRDYSTNTKMHNT